MDRKIKGYSALEILMVLAIIGIIGVIFVQEFRNYVANERLKEGLNQLLSELERVKNRAVISAVPWGIRGCIGTNKYKVFMDYDGDCRDSNSTCDVTISRKYCANMFNKPCNSDSDCDNIPNTCFDSEVSRELPEGVIFSHSLYVVFDRKGWPFYYYCGFGATNATLKSSVTGKTYKIIIDRLGRIRVE